MNICLIDIDSKIPNLALKKIEKYYADLGCKVVWNNLTLCDFGRIFVSCIFKKSKDKLEQFIHDRKCSIGGSGLNLTTKLPKQIYDVKPRINIDFATRGCNRKCLFCIVPEKEGKIKVERDLYDIWDGRSKEITLLDNNILAAPEHFKLICTQAQKENITIDFNQGLDIRLINDENAIIISKTRIKEFRFALDHVSLINIFDKKLNLLKKHIPACWPSVYVLVGYDSTFKEDMERLEYLKKVNCRPYVMRHEKVINDPNYYNLAAWANQRSFFMAMEYQQFVIYRRNRKKIDKQQTQLF